MLKLDVCYGPRWWLVVAGFALALLFSEVVRRAGPRATGLLGLAGGDLVCRLWVRQIERRYFVRSDGSDYECARDALLAGAWSGADVWRVWTAGAFYRSAALCVGNCFGRCGERRGERISFGAGGCEGAAGGESAGQSRNECSRVRQAVSSQIYYWEQFVDHRALGTVRRVRS